MSLRNYIDKLNRYFWFSKEEWLSFFVAVAVLSIIYIWPETGSLIYLNKIPIAIIFIAITLFVHHAGQRMMALSLGLRAENRLWWYGPLIGLILVMVSGGNIKFLAATATTAYMLPAHRLGAFRYGPGLTTLSKISLAGPVFNILFSAIIRLLEWGGILSTNIGTELFTLNVAFALWNLLPIPPLDGAKVLYESRLVYAFVFGSVAAYAFMVFALNFNSYLIALILGGLVWLAYLIFGERVLKAK